MLLYNGEGFIYIIITALLYNIHLHTIIQRHIK
jgi:hypothetical protein